MLFNLKNNFVKIFVTAGGVGFSPIAPGTMASLPAVFLAWFFPQWSALIFLLLLFLSLLCCFPAEKIFAKKDPSCFVMDEVCGMMLTLLNIPHDLKLFILGFIIFRLLDILKPWPIILLQRIKHPHAIVWDDIAAGVIANFILMGLSYFI